MVLTDEQQEITDLKTRLALAQLEINALHTAEDKVREVLRFWEPRTKDLQAHMMFQQLVAASHRAR